MLAVLSWIIQHSVSSIGRIFIFLLHALDALWVVNSLRSDRIEEIEFYIVRPIHYLVSHGHNHATNQLSVSLMTCDSASDYGKKCQWLEIWSMSHAHPPEIWDSTPLFWNTHAYADRIDTTMASHARHTHVLTKIKLTNEIMIICYNCFVVQIRERGIIHLIVMATQPCSLP